MSDYAIPELIDRWTTDWEEAMSERSSIIQSSIIREILKFSMQVDSQSSTL